MIDVSDLSNLYEKVKKDDIITPLQPLLNRGFFFRNSDNKFTCRDEVMFEYDWIYFNAKNSGKHCTYWRQIMFFPFGIVPKYCFEKCYKVVIKIDTFEQLMKVYRLLESLPYHSKCGIENRPWVNYLYGGYIYCLSENQVKNRTLAIRQKVHDEVDPNITVIGKKACTEFELKHGPLDQFKSYPKEWADKERRLDALCSVPKMDVGQGDEIKLWILRNWIEWAYKNGDHTVKNFNEGLPIVTPIKELV